MSVSDDELKGYKGLARSKLIEWGVKVWSDVRVVNDAGSEFEGVILPRSETFDDLHLVIKMKNGYNIGVHVERVTKIDEIGFKDCPQATQITPDGAFNTGFGELRLALGAPPEPVDVRVRTLHQGYLPIVEYTLERDGADFEVQAFATPPGLDPRANLLNAVRVRLGHAVNGHQIVSVGLGETHFGSIRIWLANEERGYLTMFRQILAGLEASDADVVFFCEHDVLYPEEHFEFVPPKKDVIYYNENVWKVDAETGRALHYWARQTSGLCAYRETLLEHYRKRVALVREKGYSTKMGFEPGTHGRPGRVDDLTSEGWMSKRPLVDIRHGQNLTPSRWKKEEFRNQKYTEGWTEADEVPGWGRTKGRFQEFLREVL